MARLIGLLSALLLGLLILVPFTAAADPTADDKAVLVMTGGDITLPAGQHVDVLVIVNGVATISGEAESVVVVNGTANLVGGSTKSIFAVQSQVSVDAASTVTGDVRTIQSTVTQAPGASIQGGVHEAGLDLAVFWGLGTVLFFIYLAFAISAIAAGLLLVAVAGRQVRQAGAILEREPLQSFGAGLAGVIGLCLVGALAVVTIFGIPLGLGLLVVVLPALLFAGYLVVGVWVGDRIVGRNQDAAGRGGYLAALVGLVIVGAVSIVPFLSGLIGLTGAGAIVLGMWRAARSTPVAEARGGGALPAATHS